MTGAGLHHGLLDVLITTPTGQIGSRVLSSLLERGEHLRVVVRDPARGTPASLSVVAS